MTKSILALMGGGIDSTAMIAYYLKRGYCVSGLHFNYGQPPNEAERSALERIVEHYKIEMEYREILRLMHRTNFEYKARNAVFILGASALAVSKSKDLAIGIHSDAPYYDCSNIFVKHIQHILDGYYEGLLQLHAPLLHLTKGEIFEFCRQEKVPIELTYSCEKGGESICGICPSCQDREQWYAY